MKQLVTFSALALSLALGSAHAAEEKAPTKQQTKMATCNADAKTKDLKGDERKEAEQNNEAARLWISGLEAVGRKLGLARVPC